MKYKQRKVYRYLKNGNIMAEGTVEAIASKTEKSLSFINQNIYRTRQGMNKSNVKIFEVGKYIPVYEFSREGVVEDNGTVDELAETLFMSKNTLKNYAIEKEVGRVKMKYLGTKFVKLEEDEG